MHSKQSLKAAAEPSNIFVWAQLEKKKALNVSEQAHTTTARHCVVEEDNPQTDVLRQLLLSTGFTTS